VFVETIEHNLQRQDLEADVVDTLEDDQSCKPPPEVEMSIKAHYVRASSVAEELLKWPDLYCPRILGIVGFMRSLARVVTNSTDAMEVIA